MFLKFMCFIFIISVIVLILTFCFIFTEMRGRVMSELESRSSVCAGSKYHSTNLCRSRSAQSLKLLGDSASQV